MTKFPTFPTLYDECKTISITKLKEWNYLTPNQIISGVITWSDRYGMKTASISITVNMYLDNPFIELSYNCNDEPIKYKVHLVCIPSNLASGGQIWLFQCPKTGKRCRKLYLIASYFLHREAFKGCYYEKQVQSKYYRYLDKQFGAYFSLDSVYEEIYSKGFTKFYAGKATKRYKRLMNILKKASSISHEEIEGMFLK